MANNLILYPLLILLIVAGFNQLLVYTNVNLASSSSINVNPTTGNQTINEETSQYTGDSTQAVFNIDMVTGLIALIIALVVVGVVAGIRVLGSGLSEHSVKLIYNSTVYYGLWFLFSALAFTAFNSIPTYGIFLWLGMTLIYSLGFFQTINGSGGSD